MSLARAESARVWTVRSSWVLAGLTLLAVTAFGVLVGSTSDAADISPGSTAWDGGRMSAMFALFGVLALAVVTATADHTTGGIVPTMLWTPQRGRLLATRVGVLALTCTVVGLLGAVLSSVAVRITLPALGLPAADGAEQLASIAYLHLTGALMAVGLGLLLRSTAGGLMSVIALVLVLPFLLAQLGYDWSTAIAAHLPGASALFLVFGEGPIDDMTTLTARLTLGAWALGALALGGVRFVRADAG